MQDRNENITAPFLCILRAGSRDDDEGAEPNPMTPLKRAYGITLCLALCEFIATTRWLLYAESAPRAWIHFSGCGMMGMLTSYIFILSTQYYTDYYYPPVRAIAAASTTGHGQWRHTFSQAILLVHCCK